jgi:hypothetical protein
VQGLEWSLGLWIARTVHGFAAVAVDASESLGVLIVEAAAFVEKLEEHCSMIPAKLAAGVVGLEMTG